MVRYDFIYEDRLNAVYRTLSSHTMLRQQQSNDLFVPSPELIKIVENSLVVAIYSLSEQLLKDTIYKILEVEFDESRQRPVDKFILDKMNPERYPITPDLDRIKKEIRLFYPGFKLFLPNIVQEYKLAYVELVKARHDYAHANNHTENIEFDRAIKFVEYLYLQYQDLGGEGYISKIRELYDVLPKIIDKTDFSTFQGHWESKKVRIEHIIEEIENADSDIEYLNTIYEPLKNAVDNFEYLTENTFDDIMIDIRESLTNL